MTLLRLFAYKYAMTLTAFRRELERRVRAAGSQRNLAKQLGVSAMFLCDILKGRRDPGAKLLTAMGYERKVSIRRKVVLSRLRSEKP